MNQMQQGQSVLSRSVAGVPRGGGLLRSVCWYGAAVSLAICISGAAIAEPPVEGGVVGPGAAPLVGDAASSVVTQSAKKPLGALPPTERAKVLGQTSAKSGDSASSGLTRMVVSLGAVLLLIVVVAKVAKRFVGPKLGMATSLGPAKAPSGILEIIGRYSIGSGISILLLKVDRRVLVLSQSAAGKLALRGGGASLATLCEISDAEEVASILTKARDAEGDSIAAKFRELLEKYSGSEDDTAMESAVKPQRAEGEPGQRATVMATKPRMEPIRIRTAGRLAAGAQEKTEVVA